MQLAMVKISDLRVDHSYQRDLQIPRANRIAKAFSEGAMKAVSVSQRDDGQLYVYDGMHTMDAADAAGLTHIPAVIVKGDQKKEAEWFTLINGSNSKRVSARDKLRAGVVAEDKASTKLADMLAAYGVEIGRGGSRKNQTNSIGTLNQCMRTCEKSLNAAMMTIKKLWDDEDCAWSSVVIRGMFDIAKTGIDIDNVAAECKARKITARRILDVASALQLAAGGKGSGAAHAKNAILKLCKIK